MESPGRTNNFLGCFGSLWWNIPYLRAAVKFLILFLSYSSIPTEIHREWQGVVVRVDRHGAVCFDEVVAEDLGCKVSCQVDFIKYLRDNFFRKTGLRNGKAL